MVTLEGAELEEYGKEVFERMQLTCVYPLSNVRLMDLDPSGPYTPGEHLELDYLIPVGESCLMGEITSRTPSRNLERKYQKFRRVFDLLSRLQITEGLWKLLGVSDPSQQREFRQVRSIRGFFIVTDLTRFDLNLDRVHNIACFYSSDWELLDQYSQSIHQYARYPFLELFDLTHAQVRQDLVLKQDSHSLIRTPDKKISGSVELANIYTFEASPYELLPMAKVYRRDMLPDLASGHDKKYQRPLLTNKLLAIREQLLVHPDFMFPNSILVVLDSDSRYSMDEKALRIPQRYGAISVIDGQHRLFSYASQDVEIQYGQDAKIMVTAIQFRDPDPEKIRRYSARAFIEINTNQTKVPPTHLDAIAYDILGEKHAKAIAAQIILRVNERPGKPLYGLFDTNQTKLGIIQTRTILTALKSYTDIERIRKLQTIKGNQGRLRRQGYENLFGTPIIGLCEPETLIRQGIVCFEHYFSLVASTFSRDWPTRDGINQSSLKYAKMISGFVSLLGKFIAEGLGWNQVEEELKNIRVHILQLRRMGEYNGVLFDEADERIPGPQPSASEDFKFLERNRRASVSIRSVRKTKTTR